eukprot:3334634-Pyramimonas_sp.AAC.2
MVSYHSPRGPWEVSYHSTRGPRGAGGQRAGARAAGEEGGANARLPLVPAGALRLQDPTEQRLPPPRRGRPRAHGAPRQAAEGGDGPHRGGGTARPVGTRVGVQLGQMR